jgi:hypothetical protein
MAGRDGDVIEGTWAFDSVTMPSGEAGYTGALAIERYGAAWLLDWDISDGRYVGMGLVAGNHLYVSCGEHLAGLGLALIELGPDGGRVTWTNAELAGATGSGWLRLEAGRLAGRHALALRLPDGRIYGEWTLELAEAGPYYNLAWLRGEVVHWRGIGLPTPGGLAAGWGADLRQLAMLDYSADPQRPGELSAVWALGGRPDLGTELAHRVAT